MKLFIKESDNKKFMKETLRGDAIVRITNPYIIQTNNIKITYSKYYDEYESLDFDIEGNMKAKGDISVEWYDGTAKLNKVDINITHISFYDIDRELVNYDESTNTITIDDKLKRTLFDYIICDELCYSIDGSHGHVSIDDSLIENANIEDNGLSIDSISFALSNQAQIDDLNAQYDMNNGYGEDDYADEYPFGNPNIR